MRRRLIPLPFFLSVALALLAPGCSPNPTAHSPPNPHAPPRRVVCASPAVAEIVFALGCGDRVVAVADFTDWPPEAAALPKIGGALSPSRERILALGPDLLLSQGKSENLLDFARSHRIPFLSLPLDSIGDLRAAAAGFADALRAPDNARTLLEDLDRSIAAIPRAESRRVFVAIGHSPGDLSGILTAGPGTFLHELVALAGGANVFADVASPWPAVSRESILRREPDFVLDFQPSGLSPENRDQLAADWLKMGFRPDQIRILDDNALLRPTPRAVRAASRIADAIR